MTVDLDGVVCAPLFGVNLGIHRELLDPEAPAPAARVWPRWIGDPLDHLRFDLRRPVEGAAEALGRLAVARELVLLTGRRSSPAGWLRRHGLERYFSQVLINEGGLKSPHYKLEQVERLGAAEHVDDDGRTAQLLAQRSGATVYLREWPRNRELALDAGVIRVADLGELAALVERGEGSPAP
jgi:phosphoglycolate phosphatase-like HAD superfamily hydrolase